MIGRSLFVAAVSVTPGQVIIDPPVVMDPTQAVVDLRWVGGVGAIVLAGLLLLLYVYRRRLYVLLWTVGWLLLSAALFVASHHVATPTLADAALGVSQFLVICSSLFFVLSVDNFSQRKRAGRRHLVLLLPQVLWFTLAPLPLGSWTVLVPGHVVVAGILATASVGYLAVLRRTHLLGAGVVGAAFGLIALSSLWLAGSLGDLTAGFSARHFSVTALLYLLAGLGMHLLVFEDMTYELRRTNRRLETAQDELRQLVITDALTGCYNRRYFEEIIGREIERHRRYAMPLSLVFVDVDRFKAVNDALGHEAGDRVLQHVADFLVRNVREADYVFRWGGDEFLILISCTEDEARRKSARLRARFRALAETEDLPDGIGLSIGCVEVVDESPGPLEMVRKADERMYEDKSRVRRRRA